MKKFSKGSFILAAGLIATGLFSTTAVVSAAETKGGYSQEQVQQFREQRRANRANRAERRGTRSERRANRANRAERRGNRAERRANRSNRAERRANRANRSERRARRYDRGNHGQRFRGRRNGYTHFYNGYYYSNPWWLYAAPIITYGASGYGGSNYDLHVEWCEDRYRSYDERRDAFKGYDGLWHTCNSPYS